MKPSVILLTFNSADSLPATLASVATLTDDIHLVDSGSTDATLAIAASFSAHVLHHPFLNYGAQRNWAIDTISARYPWQLHLDADERLTPALRDEIAAIPDDPSTDGFFIPRYLRFMGRLLRHNLAPTWHMRLFRTGFARCEDRLYDQHFLCSGPTARLQHSMVDDIRMSLSEWTSRHNRWADAEVRELLAHHIAAGSPTRVQASLTGTPTERKRALRHLYDRVPLFVRPFALFFYRYILRGGFLDGREGFIFCVLQTFWFRFLIDGKLYEATHPTPADTPPAKP